MTDSELLANLASDDPAVRRRADKEFRRGADPAKARRFLALLHTKPFVDIRLEGVGLVFISVLAEHGASIPPAYDDLIRFDYEEHVVDQEKRWRQVAERLPMARRIKLLTRGATKDSGTRRRIFATTLDLAPKLAREVLARARDEEELRRVLADLADERDPEIIAAVAKYALPPLPPLPPKGSGPFTFDGPVIVEPADFKTLDKVRKQQYRIAAGAYVGGGPVKNPRDFIAKLRRDELDEEDAEMRTWRVLRDGLHAYDLWVVWVDNGTFFLPSSATRAPVQMIQGSFLPDDKKSASIELAHQLSTSEPATGLWRAQPKPKSAALLARTGCAS